MAEVLQCDRDAAARLMPVNTVAECERVADTRSGRNDGDHRVQAFAAYREAAEKAERQAVVDWLAEQEKFHEATYQDARKANDDAAMDRCAARARSYGHAHDCIECRDHRKG